MAVYSVYYEYNVMLSITYIVEGGADHCFFS